MKYAILDDAGSVVNIAESAYQVETNWREIPSNTPVAIGDTMGADSTYYRCGRILKKSTLSAIWRRRKRRLRRSGRRATTWF